MHLGYFMSRLGCKCGNPLSNVNFPTTDMIHVWHDSFLKAKLEKNPKLTVWDFYFDEEETEYEYWFCPECKRVMVIGDGGRVLFRYKPVTGGRSAVSDIVGWTKIYYISDIDMYNYTETYTTQPSIDPPVHDLIDNYVRTFFISLDRKLVCSMDADGKYSVRYELEDSIPPETQNNMYD